MSSNPSLNSLLRLTASRRISSTFLYFPMKREEKRREKGRGFYEKRKGEGVLLDSDPSHGDEVYNLCIAPQSYVNRSDVVIEVNRRLQQAVIDGRGNEAEIIKNLKDTLKEIGESFENGIPITPL